MEIFMTIPDFALENDMEHKHEQCSIYRLWKWRRLENYAQGIKNSGLRQNMGMQNRRALQTMPQKTRNNRTRFLASVLSQ